MPDEGNIFSVIVAVLNQAGVLEQCIQSVVSQTYTHKELIVMDGGSTDGSLSILEANARHIAYWESKPDRGVYHAWNKALAQARGNWICFLGADDYFWNEHVLENLIPHLERATLKGLRIVYGRVGRVRKDGRLIRLHGKPWGKIRWLMAHGMPLVHAGIMHHSSLFQDHGAFDESFRIAGDYECLLRELKTARALFAEGVCTVAHREGGMSDTDKLLTCREIARARRIHGLPRFSWVWSLVYLRALLQAVYKSIRRGPKH